jgi:type IV secretory pathway TrbL component
VKTLVGALVILSASQAVQARTNADQAAVGKVPQVFAAAWAKHNGHQLARMIASDADCVNVGGD